MTTPFVSLHTAAEGIYVNEKPKEGHTRTYTDPAPAMPPVRERLIHPATVLIGVMRHYYELIKTFLAPERRILWQRPFLL